MAVGRRSRGKNERCARELSVGCTFYSIRLPYYGPRDTGPFPSLDLFPAGASIT